MTLKEAARAAEVIRKNPRRKTQIFIFMPFLLSPKGLNKVSMAAFSVGEETKLTPTLTLITFYLLANR
jgi:hypothetical protein